jgi:predicted DNA-binding transcriptional regulator YafY
MFCCNELKISILTDRCIFYFRNLGYTKSNLVIHLSRVKEAKSTDKPFKFQDQHKVGYIDPFRSYGWEKFKIRLLLNHRSYGHIIDEFPLTFDCCKFVGYRSYILETDVCNYYQVARFIQGFADDVSILDPPELKEYVRTNLQKGLENLDREPLFKQKQVHQKKTY